MKKSIGFGLLSIATTTVVLLSQLLVDPPNDRPDSSMDSLGDAIMITILVTIPLAVLAAGFAVVAVIFFLKEHRIK